MKKQAQILFLLSFFPSSVFALSSEFTSESPSLNRKVRNLGMGNVGVALRGDPDSSPFYNPAGLNDLEKGRMQFFSFTGDMSKHATTLINDVKDLKDGIDAATTPAERAVAFDEFINKESGEFNHIRFTIDIFNYVRRNFAVGVLADEKLDVAVRSPSQVDMRNFGDAAMYLSGSHGFWGKNLQAGVTLKPTFRFALDEEDQRVTLIDILGNDSNGKSLFIGQLKNIEDLRFDLATDVGLKSDLGFLKSLPGYDTLKPQIGLTWQDMGAPSFGTAEGNPQSINAGLAIHPDFGIFKNAVALDFRDLNQEKDFLAKLHFGMEMVIDFPVSLSIRGGISQGYFTGGLSVDLWAMKIDGAIYSEEVGIKTKREGSLRWAATIAFNL